jgi:hypothetical protein
VIVRSLEKIPEPATFKIAPPSPSFPIREQLARPPVCLEIGLGVRQGHIVVAARQEAVTQRGEHARLVAAEVVGEDQVQRRTGLRLVLRVPVRAYRRYTQGTLSHETRPASTF